MKKLMGSLVFCLAVYAPAAGAYQYALQFSPNAGYRNLVVAGYEFVGTNVVGNCSYTTTSGGSGKGGGSSHLATTYSQTCTWDVHGNLLSVTPGAPVAPHPLYVNENQVIYAVDAHGNTTGTDVRMRERGFVGTPGGHYSWVTRMSEVALHPGIYSITAVLKSDGDSAVNVSAVTPSALHGVATLQSTTCGAPIQVGADCSIAVLYDVRTLAAGNKSVLDTFRIDLTSDAEASQDFIQKFLISPVPAKN